MEIQPINIIHILIIWLSLLFSVILLTPKYIKRPSNKYISAILFTLGIHFIYNLLYSNGYYLDVLPKFSCLYGFLYGPLIYLHTKFYINKDIRFKTIDWIHFFPFLSILFTSLLGYKACGISQFWILPIMFVYCFLAFRIVYRYTKITPQVHSKSYSTQIKWLKGLLTMFLVIIILDMIQSQYQTITFGSLNIEMEIIVQFGLLILVNTIIYHGIKNPLLFQKISKEDVEVFESIHKKKPGKELNLVLLKEISTQLEEYFKKNKPYLNPELNLNTLSKELNISVKSISQAINHIVGCNFTDYINSYRIEDVKTLLRNHSESELSIKEAMYDVGFSSRSVFNTAFKKKTGITPSQFRSSL